MKHTLYPRIFLQVLLTIPCWVLGQSTLVKGKISTIKENETISQDYQIYLPKNYSENQTYPLIIFLSSASDSLRLKEWTLAAELESYILISPVKVQDTLPLSDNITYLTNAIEEAKLFFPKSQNCYAIAGEQIMGTVAATAPLFLANIAGVIAINANQTVTVGSKLKSKKVYFLNLVNKNHHSLINSLADEKALNTLKIDNAHLTIDTTIIEPVARHIARPLALLKSKMMILGNLPTDNSHIENVLTSHKSQSEFWMAQNKPLLANDLLTETEEIFKDLGYPTLKEMVKELRKTKAFKNQNRTENNLIFQESLLREDYRFAMTEDIETLNYKNLGWWKYQTEQLEKLKKDSNIQKVEMGNRLLGYLKALTEDTLTEFGFLEEDTMPEQLWIHMLQTIVQKENPIGYLKVIDLSCQLDDLGTALFYTEELLKKGFSDLSAFYSISSASLLRITPEFNQLMEYYLGKSIYKFETKQD